MRIILLFSLLIASSLAVPTSWNRTESGAVTGTGVFTSQSFSVPLLGGQIEGVLDLNDTVDVVICLKAVDPIPASVADWASQCTHYIATSIAPAPTTEPPTTAHPTDAPTTVHPTEAPTVGVPTHEHPTEAPTVAVPTHEVPTEAPTVAVPTHEVPTEAPTVAVPTTEAPTEAPTVAVPTTEAPTEAPTVAVPTTEAPTDAPTTVAPTTEAPTDAPTDAPTTTAPPTAAPTTTAPPTASPTDAPTTAPPTDAPTTTAPPTAAPTTTAPPTAAPTTTAPPTAAPTTTAPPTAAPTTTAPPTAAPTTTAPPTAAPTTTAPPTAAPTTTAPPTVAPTTTAPPTVVPTTTAPPTVVPTTASPTTLQPTTTAPILPTAPLGLMKRDFINLINPATVHFNFTLGTTRTTYTVGVALKYPSGVVLHFDLQLSSEYACTSDSEVPPSCATAFSMNDTRNVSLPTKEEQYYYTDIPNFTSDYTFTTTEVVGFAKRANPNLEIYVGYGYVPSANHSDYHGTDQVTVPTPPPGRYYALVLNNNAVQANFTGHYAQLVCNPAIGKFGVNCSTVVTPLTPHNMSQETLSAANSTTYMVIATGAPITLSAAQLPYAAADSIPAVSVRKNNVPSSNPSYNDVNGCSPQAGFNCSRVVQVYFPVTTQGDYYFITVTGKSPAVYGTWVQDVCPYNCSGHGTCDTTTALCHCTEDFSATFYCSAPGGNSKLPIEYVVLIVIGCLVVLSAIIGFIAWAYMRRKRIHYEKV